MTRHPALLTAVVVLAVAAGCAAEPRAPQAQTKPSRSISASTTPSATRTVSTEAPTRPYVLRGRLHAGGRVLPGRFGALTAGGDAWVAFALGGRMVWGVGSTAHTLPDQAEARLSANGRWLAVSPGLDACMGDKGENACVLRLLDTSGKDAGRRLTIRRTLSTRPGGTTQVDVLGVTDRGVVVMSIHADNRWDEFVWDAAGGADTLDPLVDGRHVTEWAMLGWEPQGFGPAGFEFRTGNVPATWLGEIVDGELRARVRLPAATQPGPGGRWALGTAWTHDRTARGRSPRTTQVLKARRIDGGSARVRMRAPRGWFFAVSNSGNLVFWESPSAFVTTVVDARRGGERLARCDIPLATCVLVAD